MKPETSVDDFEATVLAAGLNLDAITAVDAFHLFENFYVNVRAEGCDVEAGGDLLIFQWGRNEDSEGFFFEVNLTRQFNRPNPEDPEKKLLSQLSLDFHYPETKQVFMIKEGSEQCLHPSKLPEFRAFIETHAPYQATARNVTTATLSYYDVL